MKYSILILFAVLLMASCNRPVKEPASAGLKQGEVHIKNALDVDRNDVLLHLDVAVLESKYDWFDAQQVKFTDEKGNVLPFQMNDTNNDGLGDQLAVLVDLKANEDKDIVISPLKADEKLPVFKKRTQAEIAHKVNGEWKEREYIGGEFKNVDYLRVPPEHKDHSWFIRYEGPGWESDLVGYRFYLDARNATDIFGKKTKNMVLQGVGQDGFDSYHEEADWGMDVLKVGKSLGVGSLGFWTGDKVMRVEKTDSLSCAIVENGPVESKIQTKYFGWNTGAVKTSITSDISIHAGSRLSHQVIQMTEPLPNMCTGIVKHENGKLLRYENGQYAYIATWGKQSLADDHLGMAVLYDKNDLIEITEDEHSHVIVLQPENKQLNYYYLATWKKIRMELRPRKHLPITYNKW